MRPRTLDGRGRVRRDDPPRADPVGRARRVHERATSSPRSTRSGAGSAARDDYHVVVVASTVMPGSCEASCAPALERASGRRDRRHARPLLQPGVHRARERHPRHARAGHGPDRRVRPARGRRARARSTAGVCENDPPFRRMSLVNAELTKIAVNTYVTMKISYANTLADICERLPGADVEVVTDALGLDTRIGRKYLRGAIAYGGPCFPRDNKAFAVLARDLGAEPLARRGDRRGQRRPDRAACAHRARRGSRTATRSASSASRTSPTPA